MRKLFFLTFVFGSGLAIASACDPSLTIATTPGDGGPEGGTTSGGPGPADDSGSDGGGEGGTTDGSTTDGGSTHVIDGTNDFGPGEKFDTTSLASGYHGYASWDAKNLYFGMDGPDISASTSNANGKWVMIFIGVEGQTGTTTGLSYGGVQQPTLPFQAIYNLRWKVDGTFPDVQHWNGTAWVTASLVDVPFTVARAGTFVEMSITQASIGSPTKLYVHMNMLIEGNAADWTYAGVPSTSFVDMKNPNFTKYYAFDLSNTTTAPNAYTPQ